MYIEFSRLKEELINAQAVKTGNKVKWSLVKSAIIIEGILEDSKWDFSLRHRDRGYQCFIVQKGNPISKYEFNDFMSKEYKSTLEPKVKPEEESNEAAKRIKESDKRSKNVIRNPLKD